MPFLLPLLLLAAPAGAFVRSSWSSATGKGRIHTRLAANADTGTRPPGALFVGGDIASEAKSRQDWGRGIAAGCGCPLTRVSR